MSKEKDRKIKEQRQFYEESEIFRETPLIDERYELINGVRYDLKPSPTFTHQMLVTHVWSRLFAACHPEGLVVVAPMDVHLDEENILQPDVIFISHDRLSIIQDEKIKGAPTIVVEILSPSTANKDKILKKEVYERFGVQEYWIVDPVHRLIDQFVLQDGRYTLFSIWGEGDVLNSPVLSCIDLDVHQLFERSRVPTLPSDRED